MNKLVPMNKDSCPKCGTANPQVISYSDTVDFRSLELEVENLLESRCSHCGHKWEEASQRAHNHTVIRDAYAVVRDELRDKEGLMSGKDIALLRESFALSQREAATLFGGGYNAFNKYESGEVLQSFAMDRLLRLTEAVGQPAVDFLRNVYSLPSFVVISTNRPNWMRIEVNIGGNGFFAAKTISGTSMVEKIAKYEPTNLCIGYLANPASIPVAHESYRVLNQS